MKRRYGKSAPSRHSSPTKHAKSDEPSWASLLSPVQIPQPLNGVVALVDVTVDGVNTSSSLETRLSALGAKVAKKWTVSVTHLIFKDGNTKSLSKASERRDVTVVSPLWIDRCAKEGKRLPESEFSVDTTIALVLPSKKGKLMTPTPSRGPNPDDEEFSSSQVIRAMGDSDANPKPRRLKRGSASESKASSSAKGKASGSAKGKVSGSAKGKGKGKVKATDAKDAEDEKADTSEPEKKQEEDNSSQEFPMTVSLDSSPERRAKRLLDDIASSTSSKKPQAPTTKDFDPVSLDLELDKETKQVQSRSALTSAAEAPATATTTSTPLSSSKKSKARPISPEPESAATVAVPVAEASSGQDKTQAESGKSKAKSKPPTRRSTRGAGSSDSKPDSSENPSKPKTKRDTKSKSKGKSNAPKEAEGSEVDADSDKGSNKKAKVSDSAKAPIPSVATSSNAAPAVASTESKSAAVELTSVPSKSSAAEPKPEAKPASSPSKSSPSKSSPIRRSSRRRKPLDDLEKAIAMSLKASARTSPVAASIEPPSLSTAPKDKPERKRNAKRKSDAAAVVEIVEGSESTDRAEVQPEGPLLKQQSSKQLIDPAQLDSTDSTEEKKGTRTRGSKPKDSRESKQVKAAAKAKPDRSSKKKTRRKEKPDEKEQGSDSDTKPSKRPREEKKGNEAEPKESKKAKAEKGANKSDEAPTASTRASGKRKRKAVREESAAEPSTEPSAEQALRTPFKELTVEEAKEKPAKPSKRARDSSSVISTAKENDNLNLNLSLDELVPESSGVSNTTVHIMAKSRARQSDRKRTRPLNKVKERVVALTGCSAATKEIVLIGINTLKKCKYVDDLDSCTHLVMEGELRTPKVMFAIARGAWVVTPAWVISSLEQGRWLEEAPFENQVFAGAKLSRASRQDNDHPLFHGLSFFVAPSEKGDQTTLQQLIVCAGGQAVDKYKTCDVCIAPKDYRVVPPTDGSESESADSPVRATSVSSTPVSSAPEERPLVKRSKVPVGPPLVKAQWLFDSLAQFKLLPVRDYDDAISLSPDY